MNEVVNHAVAAGLEQLCPVPVSHIWVSVPPEPMVYAYSEPQALLGVDAAFTCGTMPHRVPFPEDTASATAAPREEASDGGKGGAVPVQFPDVRHGSNAGLVPNE